MTAPRRPAENSWIAAGGGFIAAAWFWPAAAPVRSTGVLIVPGIAHEERTMSVGVVALAESLARAGLPALLIDLHGTSQSSGRLDDPDIGERWRDGIRTAVQQLREAGLSRVIVVGVRLGATLALEALRELPLFGMVAWSPIVSGRRHARELKVLRGLGNGTAESSTSALSIGGFDIPASVVSHIESLDLARLDHLAPRKILVVDGAARLNTRWLERFTAQGAHFEVHESGQTETWLFSASDEPVLPLADIETVTRWCLQLHATAPDREAKTITRPRATATVSFTHRGQAIRETFVEIGSAPLAGVLCEPLESPLPGATRLLMSTVGPGRTFTDFARDEASRGRVSLRFDFAGFGTSQRQANGQGGELYTDAGRDDVIEALAHLRAQGHDDVVMLGFCAGAWSMMQAGPLPGVQGAAAINVALYRQPDPPRDQRATEGRPGKPRWLTALPKLPLLRRLVAKLEHSSRVKRQPVEWLELLCKAQVAVLLAYAELDPGLEYLSNQLAAGLGLQLAQQAFSLKVYKGLGHLAEGSSARARVFEDVGAFFASIDRRLSSPVAIPTPTSAVSRPSPLGVPATVATPPRTGSLHR